MRFSANADESFCNLQVELYDTEFFLHTSFRKHHNGDESSCSFVQFISVVLTALFADVEILSLSSLGNTSDVFHLLTNFARKQVPQHPLKVTPLDPKTPATDN